MRCKCGHVFTPKPDDDDHETSTQLEEIPGPSQPASASANAMAAAAPSGVIADVAAKYPGRRAKPIIEEDDPAERFSMFRDVWLPVALIAAGLVLRIAQLLLANEGKGNRWAGNISTPSGLGKSFLLVAFEMTLGAAMMGLAAFVSTMIVGVDFGPVRRAAPKLAASAIFSIGVVCWIALFNTDFFSIGGLVVALHALVILNWITIGYFFSLELHEVLLVVAIATLLYAMEMMVVWRR